MLSALEEVTLTTVWKLDYSVVYDSDSGVEIRLFCCIYPSFFSPIAGFYYY